MTIPIVAKNNRNRFLAPPRSAMAPSTGARTATMALAIELAMLRRKVLSVSAVPGGHQKSLRNTGKNTVITVTAKAELAQSYSAQPKTQRRSVRRMLCKSGWGSGRLQFSFILSAALCADICQDFGKDGQIVARPFAHQTDLNPVSSQEIFTLITQQIAGLLELPADAFGTDFAGKGHRHDGGRCMSIRGHDLKAQVAEALAQPSCGLRDLPEFIRPARALQGRLQR